MNARRACRDGERDGGAALLLAIGFVLMIGAISAGLASLVTSGVNNQTMLVAIRDRQYAADGAIESAITEVRNGISASKIDCSSDGSGATEIELDALVIRVDWQIACGVTRSADGLAVSRRDVVFSACVDAGSACADTDVLIRAEVNFERGPNGVVTHTFVQSWSVHQ